MLKKSIGWLSKARGKRQKAKGKRQKARGKRQEARCVTIEQSMNLHFYLNLIASNPYLVKLSVSQQEALISSSSWFLRVFSG
ncbi:hypothetical protein [Dactylococcopsis salina]|uniref:hypothetical protein n=1 Tax=Dactylococcopsis salina TaxID=292566 RepID=UPI0002EC2F93|nr:hypothetical protein [Dactylococcopsis salina]